MDKICGRLTLHYPFVFLLTFYRLSCLLILCFYVKPRGRGEWQSTWRARGNGDLGEASWLIRLIGLVRHSRDYCCCG